MRGVLPDSVLWRPKLSLTSDPVWEGMRCVGLPPFSPMPELSEYVNSERVPMHVRLMDRESPYGLLVIWHNSQSPRSASARITARLSFD